MGDIETDATLWSDAIWSMLERGIRALQDHPKKTLAQPNYVDGLNASKLNSLTECKGLGQVYVIEEEKDRRGHEVRRWLRVNYPGAADQIGPVLVWSRWPSEVAPSIVNRIIAYLQAWQEKRAEQLRASKAISTEQADARVPHDVPLQELVTLDQAAALVHRKVKTLHNYPDKPKPKVKAKRSGQFDLYEWSELRPWLEEKFGVQLPKKHPSLQSTSRR